MAKIRADSQHYGTLVELHEEVMAALAPNNGRKISKSGALGGETNTKKQSNASIT